MEVQEKSNDFDKLYKDLCNNLRETGKSTDFCQLIKNAKSDLNRIIILNKVCKIVPNVIKIVAREWRTKTSKDSQQARKLLGFYYSKKDNASESDNLIRLLNSALAHVEIDSSSDFDQKLLDNFEKDETIFLENLLVSEGAELSNVSESLLSEIYKERSNYFHDVGDYTMSMIEALRAINHSKINKTNPPEYFFTLLFLISSSLRHLHQWNAAGNVIQFSIKSLRSSTLDNSIKSVETVKLVKLMKEIQTLSKIAEGNDKKMLDFKSYLEPKIENVPKIFQPSNDVLINASSSLQLKWKADRGRHVVARTTIPAGATIIVERPFSWTVHPNESNSFCQNCCQEVKNLIPCIKCCVAIFCSKECQEAAEEYHYYECKFMKILTTSEILGDMALLCYRTISITDFRVLESHIREYFKILEDSKENNRENGQILYKKFVLGVDEQGQLDSMNYKSVFAQTPNSDARLGGDLLKRSFSAIVLTICLRFAGYFEEIEEITYNCNLSESEEIVASLFLRHMQSVSCNAYGINQISGDNPRRIQIKEIGGATYSTISTTNHSCNSNVYRFSIGKTCVVKTLREIHPGEEILDSYGPHFASNLIEERQRLLNGQYQFTCCCTACTEKWSTYTKLPRENPCAKCVKCETGFCVKRKDKYICTECSNKFDARKSMKIAIECQMKFQSAKELLLNSTKKSNIQYESIQNCIIDYVNALADIQKWPCQVLIECQETMKLCWNLENRT